ncbi:alpha/beta fold hydrolase [Thioalkalivibrio sp. ALJ24]|uniref:alpha/beta fold hydrolase n=1 Tax=Thioalkalivibrio sp. ALJ24 TaxID=545276 RepID=UPI00036554CA|nr:alpha/beta fold hydrolase [Thioalkalivibrio sp. ALJ24]
MPRPARGLIPAPALLLSALLALGGCGATPAEPESPAASAAVSDEPAVLHGNHARLPDGYELPLRRWGPTEPEAVVLALHGFNDYGGSMHALARPLAARGIAVYAPDQRGFGAGESAGQWAGHATMAADARALLRALEERYPESPFVAGKSMGAAVATLAVTGEDAPAVAGTVLIAPAIWARDAMPWYQRFALWTSSRLFPGLRLSGEDAAHLNIRPTDDPMVAAGLRRDPWVRADARIDSLDGLTTLMDRARAAAPDLPPPSLVLYGGRDDLIPHEPVIDLLRTLAEAAPDAAHRAVYYPDGFHLLTRYTQARQTHEDIAAWILNPAAPLPHGEHGRAASLAERVREDQD